MHRGRDLGGLLATNVAGVIDLIGFEGRILEGQSERRRYNPALLPPVTFPFLSSLLLGKGHSCSKCNLFCNHLPSLPSHPMQRNAIPYKCYPVDVSSGSLDWGWGPLLELSPGSGLRKPQVARSIRVAGSIVSA
jgi:hypothetical protein